MQVYLVATPDLSFGDLLRLSLEQENTVSVRLTNTLDQMMDAAANDPLQLVILDVDLCSTDPDAVLRHVLEHKPAMKFIVVLPENAPDWQPDISNPIAVLHQPCFISDVVEKVELLMGIHQPAEPELPSESNADFSEHNNRALAGYILSSFLRESAAHAAMILVNGEMQLSRGYLEPAEVREIARLFNQDWPAQAGFDIIRYIQLESSRLSYQLYGKEVLQDIILVLVGDARDPISEMRSQAEHLAKMLQDAMDRFSVDQPDLLSSWQVEFPATNSVPVSEIPVDELSQGETLQREKLLAILSEMPSPEPDEISGIDTDEQDGEPDILADFLAGISDGQEDKISTSSVQTGSAAFKIPAVGEKAFSNSIDTDAFGEVYSLVLLPRIPAHTLDQTLQKKLAEWLPELCQVQGWELVHLQVQPDHLLFSVWITPGELPADVVDILRRKTTARIFEFNNNYKEENPAGDFWAPGYLVLNGPQAPDDALLARFTRNTRQKWDTTSLQGE